MKKKPIIQKKRSNPDMKNLIELMIAGAFIVSLFVFFNIFYGTSERTSLTGSVIFREEKEYNQSLDISTDTSITHSWIPESRGILKSLRVSGRFSDGTNAKVYLSSGNESYLILDTNSFSGSRANIITGFAVENDSLDDTQPENNIMNNSLNSSQDNFADANDSDEIIDNETKSVSLNLIYNPDSEFDADNNGVENLNGIIDISPKAEFNWDINESYLCTKWDIKNKDVSQSTIICNGNAECCNTFGVQPERDIWNELIYLSYGKYNSGNLNLVSAQVLYMHISNVQDLPSDFIYSDVENLTADFVSDEISFDNVCSDSCALSIPEQDYYGLIINVSNGSIKLDSLRYSVEQESENSKPELVKNISSVFISKGKNLTINLDDYFTDIDGNRLIYSIYAVEDINTIIEGSFITFIPEDGFEGVRFSYVIANDSDKFAVSDVFAINVSESRESIYASASFILLNSDGNQVFAIDSNGNLNASGEIFDNAGNLTFQQNSFILKNSSGDIIAYVSDSGDVFLSGILEENSVMDEEQNSLQFRNDDELVGFFDVRGNLKIKGEIK